MVFLQIHITSPSSGFYYINLTGNYQCKIVDIRYLYNYTPNTPGDQLIALVSPQFTFYNTLVSYPNPQNVYLFTNNRNHLVSTSSIAPYCNVTLTGYIELGILDMNTKTVPSRFSSCIVSLEFTSI